MEAQEARLPPEASGGQQRRQLMQVQGSVLLYMDMAVKHDAGERAAERVLPGGWAG